MVAAMVAGAQTPAIPTGAFSNAPDLQEELLGTPARTMPIYRDTWVPNPGNKGWTRLLFYHHHTFSVPCQVAAINTATREFKKIVLKDKAPIGAPWRWCIGHDGKCYMGHYGSASVWIYDPAAMTLDFTRSDIRDVSTVSAITCGTDGKIYGSTTPKIVSFQFDPATGKFADYGVQGQKRGYLGYGYTVAADDEYVYTAAGKIPWECVAYHRQTGKQQVLFGGDQSGYIGVDQGRYGCTAVNSINAGPDKGKTRKYWLYKGQAILQTGAKDEKPPWPEQVALPPLPPKPEENIDEATPGSDGKAVYWWRTAEAKAGVPQDTPSNAPPDKLGWRSVQYDIEVAPDKITWLHEIPDGRILGVGSAYQNWFRIDPKLRAIDLLGKIPLSHYETVFAGGKVFMMGYPSTPLYSYDPDKPWTPGKGTTAKPSPRIEAPESNPRRLLYFSGILQTHHARAGAVGADGRIYVAAHAERSGVGGGLGWWDPKTQGSGGLREPFELFDVAGLCAVNDGRQIVYSSTLVTDPKDGKRAPDARLFVFDVEKQAITATWAPFPGRSTTGKIMAAGGACIIGLIPGDPAQLYRADVGRQAVVQSAEISVKISNMRPGPDGRIWAFAGNTLVRIDPATLAFEPVGNASSPGSIAFAGKDIVLGGTSSLRIVRNILK